MTEIAKYPFIICARGWGLDPNPMAWSALMVGSIPIIQRFAGEEIYTGLPVIIVDDLPSANLTKQNLIAWRDELAPMFSGGQRRQVLEHLMTDFWWDKITSKMSNITK